MNDHDGVNHEDDKNKPFMDWSWSADDQNLTLGVGVLVLFLLGSLGLSQCSGGSDVVSEIAAVTDTTDDLVARTEDALQDDDFSIGSNEISVSEKAGVITLVGSVASQADKLQAGEVAAEVDGVSRVTNNLVVDSEPALTVPATTSTPTATTEAPAPTTTVAPATTTTAAPTTTAPPPTTTTTLPELNATAVTASLVDGELVLSGEVPSEAERTLLVEQFTQQLSDSGVTVVDQMTIGEGLTLDGGIVELVGEVADDALRASISDGVLVAASGQNMTVNDQLTVAENTSLLDELNALFVSGDVLFDTANAELTPEATSTLDQAVDILNRDPALSVTIEGHTDSDGSERLNLDLSTRRADAVRSYLVDNGVAADRLIALGRGESEPIADNSTPEGKRQNRRIEFVGSAG